jgi:HNH endonuclease
MNEQERFWSHVNKNGSGCWLWTANCNKSGYGNFRIGSRSDGSRRLIGAHVWAFQEKYGKVPEGKVVCHTCDNPPCVRYSHLFAGTYLDNFLDMIVKGRDNFTGACSVPENKIQQILCLYRKGLPQKDIAAIVGVHKQNVWNYVHGIRRIARASRTGLGYRLQTEQPERASES